MSWAANTVIILAGVVTAVGVLGAGAWKMFKAIDRIEDTWVVLSEIASQFKPNDGKSLHDRIGHLEATSQQMQRDLETMLTR